MPSTLGFAGAVGRTEGAAPGKTVPEPPIEGSVVVEAYGSKTGAPAELKPPVGASGVIAGAVAPDVPGIMLPVVGGSTVPCANADDATKPSKRKALKLSDSSRIPEL